MEEGEIHCILNLDKYIYMARKSAAESFSKNKGEKLDESEDLNDYVTVNQVKQMIAENSIGTDDEDRYLMTHEGRKNLMEQLKTRIYNSGLSKLASKDLLECAWDNKKKTMLFWSKKD
jgi:hypothetical protein